MGEENHISQNSKKKLETEKFAKFQKQSEMFRLSTVTVVILAMTSWINCDICDVCMCSTIKNCTIGACVDELNENIFCNGNEENVKTDGMKFNLNSIPWPKQNGSISATFNHFKLTYLTQYGFSINVQSLYLRNKKKRMKIVFSVFYAAR